MGGRPGGWVGVLAGGRRWGAGEPGGCRVQAGEGMGLGGGWPVSRSSPEWVVGGGKVAGDEEDLG
ncbi:hypothetical protein TIFTF001_046337 [Ficus carica]|uniref:Uncharacterized protein n=1 Tax=Ficus carica TaxID=3494 RepID=A0AA87ZMN1_FICCA|nr:hypothetical protein TIFTF001_046337 [Ficus carica]